MVVRRTRSFSKTISLDGRRRRGLAAGFLALLGAVAMAHAAVGALPALGWQRFAVPATGSYFWRYVPASLDTARKAPLILFFHGAGGSPEGYLAYVYQAAERAGCVVALPQASGVGWGTAADDRTVGEMLRMVEGELDVDPNRIAVAGHSAGGAYAYLLAYETVSRYSAVFTLSAPFYPVPSVADPAYRAPIHMYYGTGDPNYAGGAEAALKQQWKGLGVSWEEDVEPGYGHSSWPPDSMTNGFLFAAGKTYSTAPPPTCIADAARLCLNGGRFRVEVTWQDFSGRSGRATATPAVSGNSGVFWFFDPSNWEMLVKVLDGCPVNRHTWVFTAATTNVQYTLTVTDTVTGQFKTYSNIAGQPAAAVTDTEAFADCP